MSERNKLNFLPLREEIAYSSASEMVLRAVKDASGPETIEELLKDELNEYSQGMLEPFIERSADLHQRINPMLHPFSTEKSDSTKSPFVLGTLAGADIVRYAYDSQLLFSTFVHEQSSSMPDGITDVELSIRTEGEIMNQCERGTGLMGKFALEQMMRVANVAVPRTQPLGRLLFTRGCGFIVAEAFDHHQRLRGPEITDVLMNIGRKNPAFDWSRALEIELLDKK